MPAPLAAAAAAWAASAATKKGKGPKLVAGLVGGVVLLLLVISLGSGVVTFISQACNDPDDGGGAVDVGPITAQAKRDIPTTKTSPTVVTLGTLTRLSNKLNIDWHFVASIAAQECDFGRCAGVDQVNGSGCIGPMQLGVGGACGDFFGTYRTDGDGDGSVSPTDPEDAVATAINGLKRGKGAPGRGGSYQQYRQAACGYYGACADAVVNYADEVMARAVAYGFRGPGTPNVRNPDETAEANAAPTVDEVDRSILNLGDSLAEGVATPLRSKLDGWTVTNDAARGETTAAAVEKLAGQASALPTVLAVSLGTNDSPGSVAAFRANVRRILEIAGPQRCVLWFTIRRPPQGGVSYAGLNRVLKRAEGEHSNLRVLDAAAGPRASDGIHLTPAGYDDRAQQIAQAAEECAGDLSPQGGGTQCGPSEGGSEAVGELGEGDPSGEALLRNPKITLDARAQGDIRNNNISPRLIALLDAITSRHTITISVLSTGHAPGTNHEPGRAADIAIVDGEVCNAHANGREGKCWQLAQELDRVTGCFHSTELIYYFDPGPSPDSFAKADHADHIHVGYDGPLGSMLTYDPDTPPCSPKALTGG